MKDDKKHLGKKLFGSPETALDHTRTKDGHDCSTVTLGNSLDFILLSDGEGVTLSDTLGGVDELVSESLSHALVGSESRFSRSLAEQVDSLVDSSEGRNINSLPSDGTTGADTGGVLSGTGLNDGLEDDLKGILISEQVDDLKSLLEDADGHLLLTILARVSAHELVDKSLENWAVDFCESLLLILAGSVGGINLSLLLLDSQVSNESLLRALDSLIGPLAEKLGLNSESSI